MFPFSYFISKYHRPIVLLPTGSVFLKYTLTPLAKYEKRKRKREITGSKKERKFAIKKKKRIKMKVKKKANWGKKKQGLQK
jgi:hypothetical protein